jgi:hypothetical protein
MSAQAFYSTSSVFKKICEQWRRRRNGTTGELDIKRKTYF